MSASNFQHLIQLDTEFEKILTNPILDIAARFWDKERYEAFKICYKSMREIDDLVDHRKAEVQTLSKREVCEYTEKITGWAKCFSRGDLTSELKEVFKKFQIPAWPWERLAKAMIYDLSHNGFKTFPAFLRYCEGAAIAPASVFMHLCGVRESDGAFNPPEFDIRKAARPLAVFSYLVHIMRDFEKDQLRNLNYFADDILDECNLCSQELPEIVKNRDFDNRLLNLFEKYRSIAGYYQRSAQHTFVGVLPQLEPKYQLSLRIIYSLYSHLYEKIEPHIQTYSETDLNLSPDEVERRIELTVSTFRPV